MALIDSERRKILDFCATKQSTCTSELVAELKDLNHDHAQELILSLSNEKLIEIVDICFTKK